MANFNTLGYSTHILGTVKSVMESLTIVLYDRYSIKKEGGYNKISLYNLEKVYEVVMNSPSHLVLNKDEEAGCFKYLYTNPNLSKGFNVIIYLSNSDNSPIGYTEFTNTQGTERDINIFLNLKAAVEDFDIILKDSLESAAIIERNYIGTRQNEYTSANSILDAVRESVSRQMYTKHVSQTFLFDDSCSILLDSGIVKHTDETELSNLKNFYKLDIVRNVDYNPMRYDFTNFDVSSFGDDVVLYSWNGLNYCASSLKNKNAFGDLIVYTKSNRGYHTILKDSADDDLTILYSAGKYLVCRLVKNRRSKIKIYNIITRKWVTDLSNACNFVDPLEVNGKVYDIPDVFYSSSIYKYLPEISNVFYEFGPQEAISVIRKIGNWVAFNKTIFGKKVVLLSGVESTLFLTQEEFDRLIVLNDVALIIKDSDKFRLYYSNCDTIYTEDVLDMIGEENSKGLKSDCITIGKEEELLDCEFSKFRKNAYLSSSKLSNIVCGYRGLIFYENNNYINYL